MSSDAGKALALTSERTAQAAGIQRGAADPATSAWVGASAGTGKTRVLTERVLRLLLAGVGPERILCLTFTKAAAAEMTERLASTLANWASLDMTRVEDSLRGLLGAAADEETLIRARQLFARVLDAPGGMKIQTIHAFCQSLLGRFPLEAEVAPHFRLLEERDAAERLSQAREQVLSAAGNPGQDAIASALAEITRQVNEQDFAGLMGALVLQRGRLSRSLAAHGGVDGVTAELAKRLGVTEGLGEPELLAAGAAEESFDGASLRRCAKAMAEGGKKDRENGQKISDWLAASAQERTAGIETYQEAFLTGEGQIRKKLIHAEALKLFPEGAEIMDREARRLFALQEALKAVALLRATGALLRLGAAILRAYEDGKRAAAVLDFDDLILECRKLLESRGISPWVLYKLDGGIEHLLIDEAQDTNSDHWRVVEALTAEFFAGESAYESLGKRLPRTIFAVGDAKQSIYSFQGAQPKVFTSMGEHFRQVVEQGGGRFAPVDLTHSFRSTDAVLTTVDAVFAGEDARDGLTFGGAWLNHTPVRVGQAGRVEVWPAVKPPVDEQAEPWQLPITPAGGNSPRARLAQAITKRIARWIGDESAGPGDEAWLEPQGRRIQPGDVLVLVRKRAGFVEELVRELKTRGVPVAGVDRMVLTDQLAVMDLAALGRALLLPGDDLTLATVLKGPLIGLSENALFELAWNRPGRLWDALRARAAEPDFREAHGYLARLAERADFVPPYEFYAEVLAQGGRERLLERLGPDAADAIEEFMSQALAYERDQVPSLEGFLHWLEAGGVEVKRDMEVGAQAVRVMTVHGAKGLQAPIVFLPDTLSMPTRLPPIFWLKGDVPLWPPREALREGVAKTAWQAARDAQKQEYRRLLYVALTRAEDRLYVAGWHGKKAPPKGSWYDMVEGALSDGLAEAVEFDFSKDTPGETDWAGVGWRITTAQRAEPKQTGGAAQGVTSRGAIPPPSWLKLAAPPERRPPRPLAPSRPSAAEPSSLSPLRGDGGTRFKRGILIHRLLQSLPDLPPERRREVGARFLAGPVHALGPDEQAEILEECLAVLETPEFAGIFGPGSRAEVPVAGVVDGPDGPQVVSGQVDRIFVDREKLLIVDFKTNRPPPRTPSEVAPAYLRQMALYKALLSEVYPGREVRCGLLWTQEARLMMVDPSLLNT